MTPAEHADEASRLAVEASRLLRDLGDGTDRDRAVMTAHAMAAVSAAHTGAALAQRAAARMDQMANAFRRAKPTDEPTNAFTEED